MLARRCHESLTTPSRRDGPDAGAGRGQAASNNGGCAQERLLTVDSVYYPTLLFSYLYIACADHVVISYRA